jgi:hypothetical protein
MWLTSQWEDGGATTEIKSGDAKAIWGVPLDIERNQRRKGEEAGWSGI